MPNNQSVMEVGKPFSREFSSSGVLDHERPPESGNVQITGSSSTVVGGLADEYISPTYLQNERTSSDAWQSFQSQTFQWGFAQGSSEKGKFTCDKKALLLIVEL